MVMVHVDDDGVVAVVVVRRHRWPVVRWSERTMNGNMLLSRF